MVSLKRRVRREFQFAGSEYVIEEEGTEKVYRLITDLMDISVFPALLLAQEYHQRWEAENTLDELKVHASWS